MTELKAARPNYHIIDPHVHVWTHDPQFPFAAGAHVPARDAAPEALLGGILKLALPRRGVADV